MARIQTGSQIVTQITIEAEPATQKEALSLMADRARFMARQPGFVSISRSACIEASTVGASSTTPNGKIANSCILPTNRRAFVRSGVSLIT
jgi:hypothetical protein